MAIEDHEWQEHAFDDDSKAALEELFSAAGIPVTGWMNHVPEFSTEVDPELVQKIVLGDDSSSSSPDTSAPDQTTPKKGGWPKGKPRGKKGA